MSDFYPAVQHRKARKPHRCSTCFRRIDTGETYDYATGIYDGRWYTFRQCIHCVAILNLYDPTDDEGLISETGYDYWQDRGARDIAELRHIVQYRRRWRRADGQLYPVPDRKAAAS